MPNTDDVILPLFDYDTKHLEHAAWGTWENIAFYKRNGYAESFAVIPEWIDLWFERMNSEDAVRKMAEAGITFIISRYFKGFGMEAEEPDFKYAREQIKWCKKYGIRYIAYVQCLTLSSETFLKEVPEARDWARRNPDGSIPRYAADAHWRMEPAIYHRNFIEYLKQVIKTAISLDGADGIMLDNTQAHPCYCGSCQSAFREYVRQSPTFTPEKLSLKFIDYDSIEIPPVLGECDPLSYEYWMFRKKYFLKVLKELHEHIKSCSPRAIFVPNAIAPTVTQKPFVMLEDVNTPEYAACFDALKNDGAMLPSMDDERNITGSMMRLKIANALRSVVAPKATLGGYSPDVCPDQEVRETIARTAAEYLAFGGHPVPFMGVLNPVRSDRGRKLNLDYPSVFNTVKAYSKFVKTHNDLYQGARTAAKVFLYVSNTSVCMKPGVMKQAFNSSWTALMRERLVFGAAISGRINELPSDSILLLQDIPAMSQSECGEILDFCGRGGRLAVIGPSSWYNERYQDALEIGLSGLVSPEDAEKWNQGELLVLPGLFIEPSPTMEIGKALGLRRRCFSETRRASHTLAGIINHLNPEAWIVRLDAPDHVLVDAYNLPDGRTAVHLYNIRNHGEVRNIGITIRCNPECRGIRHFTPDYEEAPDISWSMTRETCVARISKMHTYSIIVADNTAV